MRYYSQKEGKFVDDDEQAGGQFGNITPQMASMAQLTLSPKAATQFQKAYDIQQAAQPEMEEEAKKLSGADATKAAQARSGLESVQSAKQTLFGGEEGKRTSFGGLMKLLGASTDLFPGDAADLTPWGRGLENDLFNAVEVILRGRSGAAVPEDEVKRYVKQFAPKMSDTRKVKEKKLNKIEEELQGVLSLMGQDGGGDDYDSFLDSQGF